MSRFGNMQNEAMQYGLRADLDALERKVNQLESEVQELRSIVQDLMEKLEHQPDSPQE